MSAAGSSDEQIDTKLTPAEPVPIKKLNIRINTDSLDTIRAVASIDMEVGAGISVEAFYVMAGFVCALNYGNRSLQSWAQVKTFAAEFYIKRVSRLLPVYYFCIVACFYFASEYIAAAGVFTFVSQFFFLTSWYGAFPINGPLWQISTLMFLYLIFPFFLPIMQGVQERLRGCTIMFFLQAAFYYAVLYTLGYVWARAWMPSRLPVFLMGILFGLERLNPTKTIIASEGETAPVAEHSHHSQTLLGALLHPQPTLPAWYGDVAALVVVLLMILTGVLSAVYFDHGLNRRDPRYFMEPIPVFVQGLMIYYAQCG